MKTKEFDVLIIGCGISGLSSAYKLAKSGLSIGIATRESDPKISNTYWAQGGIIYTDSKDELLKNDIQKASSQTSNENAIDMMLARGSEIVEEVLLSQAETNFEKSDTDQLLFTKEAAHSIDRIIFKGDFTGREIQVSLLNHLNDKDRYPNITFLESHTAIDLITPKHHGVSITQRYEESKVVGAYIFNRKENHVLKVIAKTTILATGGIGALYLHHSNSEGARGDGHAMASRAGANLIDMEFIQFHPTTFYDNSSHRRFLISEAVRGEGGILVNSNGERFMNKYHHDLELAPRDVVARAILEETIETQNECVYLDISFKDEEWIKSRFPTIYKHCLDKGVDITKRSIPVVPAAHYTCGGVKVDLRGRTNLKFLYAVGEVACSGLHGANRLASTSLLEGLTWGYLAAEDIVKNIDREFYDNLKIKEWAAGTETADKALIQQDWITLKQTMWNYVGLTRSSNRLKRANAMFSELNDEIERFYKRCRLTDGLIGLRNAVEISSTVLNASQRNKVSIGSFYRKS